MRGGLDTLARVLDGRLPSIQSRSVGGIDRARMGADASLDSLSKVLGASTATLDLKRANCRSNRVRFHEPLLLGVWGVYRILTGLQP